MELSPVATPEPKPIKNEPLAAGLAFIRVNFVSLGSPAEEAGIRQDDEIFEFGSINAGNFKDLKQIGEIVTHRQNQQIAIKIKRKSQVHELTLVPKPWSGRGLLGCNIVIAENNNEC